MIHLRSLATLPLALLTGAATLYPQQPAAPQRYLAVLSLDVRDDQFDAIREHYKTGTGAKLTEARFKANPKLLRYSLLQALYPGDPAPAATHMIVISTEGVSEGDQSEDLYRAAGTTRAEYQKKVRSMSTIVGRTLSHVHHTTAGFAAGEGDIIRLTRMKSKPGKQQDVYDLVRELRHPVMEAAVQQGGNLKGWSFSHPVAPTGDSLPWDLAEARVFKDLASAVGGPRARGGGGGAAAFQKVHPNRSYLDYVDRARDGYTTVRTDLWRVVVSHSK